MNDFEIINDLEERGYDVQQELHDKRVSMNADEIKVMNSVPYPHPTNKFCDYGNNYYSKYIKPVSAEKLAKRGKRVAKQEQGEDARKLLNAMGHNPITHLLSVYKRCERELGRLERIRDGELDGRYSQVAYNELLAQMSKINTDLLRYRYGRVSEIVQVENKGNSALCIELTTPETYKPQGSDNEN